MKNLRKLCKNDRGPSSTDRLWFVDHVALALSLLGAGIASALLAQSLRLAELPCRSTADCSEVLFSPAARFLGVPTAGWGLLAYLALTGLLGKVCIDSRSESYLRAAHFLSLLGSVASLLLTAYSVFVIGSTCDWCISSNVVMLLVFASVTLSRSAPLIDRGDRTPTLAIGLVLVWIAGTLLLLTSLEGATQSDRISRLALAAVPAGVLAPSDRPRQGSIEADLVIVVFADLSCPACRIALPEIFREARKRPALAVVFRSLPTNSQPTSMQAAKLAETAFVHGRFWDFIDQVLAVEDLDESSVAIVAQRCGISIESVRNVVERPFSEFPGLQEDLACARRLGIHSTPTILIVRKDGVRYQTSLGELRKLFGSMSTD